MRWITTWIACCMVACALNTYAQEWERVNFLASSSSLRSVSVTDRFVYAAGASGTIVRSDDFGTTWTPLSSDNVLWRRLRFVNDSVGWICGDSGAVGHTNDAGVTWNYVSISSSSINIRDIWSSDGRRAVAVGSYGTIAVTTDDGDSWVTVQSGQEVYDDLLAVDFADSLVGCAVGGYSATAPPPIMLTNDGGMHWTPVSVSYNGWLATVKYVTDSIIVAAGKNGRILRSFDGGQSWESVFIAGSNFVIREVDFADSLHGCAVAEGGMVFTSNDGGLTWSELEDHLQDLQGIDLTVNGFGIAAGALGVAVTEDAGQTWTEQTPIPGGTAFDIDFFDDNHGWVITQNNYVFATTDGGESWRSSRIHSGDAVAILAAVSDSVAVTVSNRSEIFRTIDGARTWATTFADATVEISGLSFANEDTGFACGQAGVMLATYNGGLTWERQDSVGYSLNSIFAIDGTHIWAVGNSGLVLRNYEGEGWVVASVLPHEYDLVGVQFADTRSGAIISANGATISTRTGGESWYVALWHSYWLADLAFANQSTGWFCGRSSYLSRTDDGGRTWSAVPPFIDGAFNALTVTSQYVWVVGEIGSVYRSEYIPNDVAHEEIIPQSLALSAFPNPFNATATLNFELPREAHTEIVLYDVLGREAMKLADDVFAAGPHSLTVNAENLATGVYFAHLRTPGYSTTTKLLLIR